MAGMAAMRQQYKAWGDESFAAIRGKKIRPFVADSEDGGLPSR